MRWGATVEEAAIVVRAICKDPRVLTMLFTPSELAAAARRYEHVAAGGHWYQLCARGGDD